MININEKMARKSKKESGVVRNAVVQYADGSISLKEAVSAIRRSTNKKLKTGLSANENEFDEESVQFTLSRKLQRTIMNVKEGGGVRQYCLHNVAANRSLKCYRCLTCANLQWSGGNLLEVPVIRMQNGKIVGNAHPVHHGCCEPVKLEEAIAVAEDREGRLRVRQGLQKPRTAFEEVCRRCTNADAEKYLPGWNSVKRAYYQHYFESKKRSSMAPSNSSNLLRSDAVSQQREERSNIKLGYDESRNKERECSNEKDYGIKNMEMEDISSDFHGSVVQPASTLGKPSLNLSESSLYELEMDDANRVLEDNGKGSCNPEEVSSSIDEALVETPPTNGIYNRNSHEKDEVAHLQPIQQANLTDNLRNDNQSESPTAEMLQSNQRPPYEEANFDTPSSSQSQLLPHIQSKPYDNNDNNQITTGKQPSKAINKISSQKKNFSEHFLKRDPRTGRIVLCKRSPMNKIRVLCCTKKPPLSEQHKLFIPNALSRESTSDFSATIVRSKPINSISNISCNISQSPIKNPRAAVKADARISNSDGSSVGIYAPKANELIIGDDCDAIAESLAKCIREIEAIDRYQGADFKIDVLKIMDRYRGLVR